VETAAIKVVKSGKGGSAMLVRRLNVTFASVLSFLGGTIDADALVPQEALDGLAGGFGPDAGVLAALAGVLVVVGAGSAGGKL
jgi:hypothetical protein